MAFPAHNSAYKGDLEYLEMVIETAVASVNERDSNGSTPLHKGLFNFFFLLYIYFFFIVLFYCRKYKHR